MSDDINVKIGAQNQGLLSGLKQAEQAVTHSTGYIRASLSGLTDVIERIKLPFIELAAILAGGVAFKELVEGTERLAIELEKASQKTGIAVEDLSGLKFAAEQVDVSFDSLVHGTEKLALSLQQATQGATTPGARALTAMGISATDASGKTKEMGKIVEEIADKFKTYKDGADKTALAMNLFGRAGADMIPFLNQGSAAMGEAKQEATEMGAVMGGPAVEAAEQFHESQGRLGLAAQGLKIALGTALMPALTMATNALADSAKEGGVLHVVIEALRVPVQILGTVFVAVVAAIQQGFATLMLAIRVFEAGIVGISLLITHLRTGEFSKMKDDWAIATTNMRTAFTDWSTDIRKSALETAKAVQGIWGTGAKPTLPKPAQNAPQVHDPSKDLAALQKLWETEKAGYDLQIALADGNEIKIIAIKQEELERVRELFGEHSKEYLQMATDLANAENEEQRKGTENYKKILKDQSDADKKAFEERKQQWEQLLSGIASAVQTSVTGIVQGTTTAGAAIKNLLKSILAEYIAVGVKTLVAHKATELAKTGATAEGAVQRVALEEWAAIKSVALGAWAAIARIAQYAVEGAAAAFKSIAAIPVVGPFLAPAAAAAAGLAIGSFAGKIASAEGGYDIPSGLNPVTQLHAQEMVLPADLANRVRSMTGAGSGGRLELHVHAMDSKDVKQFLHKHKDHLVSVLNGETRNFAFGQ